MLLYARTSSVFRRCILTSRKGCIPFRKGDNMNTINATRTSATKFNTKYMVELALMVAVILVMSLTPLGYIRTPGLSITLLTVPVAVGAIILGHSDLQAFISASLEAQWELFFSELIHLVHL